MRIVAYKKKNGDTAYKFRVYVGKANGKDKYVKRQGFSTKAKARAALLQLQDELESAEETKKQITLREISEMWLKEYVDTVQESTYIKTERNIKNHILPVFGDRQIASITALELQEQVNVWSKNLVYGRKLKGLLNNIYKYAIRHGYASNNPVESVVTLVKKTTGKEIDFYGKDELKKFLGYLDELNADDIEDLYRIVLFRILSLTGARKGEVLAFMWSDYQNATLSVNKAITRGYAGEEVGSPKTASSKRLLSLDDKTCYYLDKLHSLTPDNVYILQAENGKPMSSSLPRKWLRQILNGKDLRPISIHGFRHTHASLCFEAGMTLKQVQHRLGHSDLKTTMNIYTHITKTAKDDIGKKFANFIDF